MKKIKIKRAILFILIVAWAVLVFYMSSQTGGESSGLSRKIAEFFTKDENLLEKVERYIRKLAHFSEYALGGILFLVLFYTYDWTDRRKLATSVCLGIWYAITDEVHQLMVDGRNGSIVDVYIDSLGIATGVFSAMLLMKLISMKKLNKEKSNKIKTKSN